MHQFDGVSSIVFCASLSDYDQEVNDIDNHVCIIIIILFFQEYTGMTHEF
jgi:hypothetical protein